MRTEAMCPRILVATAHVAVGEALRRSLEAAGFVSIGPFTRMREVIPFSLDRSLAAAIVSATLVDGTTQPISDALRRRGIRTVVYDPFTCGEAEIAHASDLGAGYQAQIGVICTHLMAQLRHALAPAAGVIAGSSGVAIPNLTAGGEAVLNRAGAAGLRVRLAR